MMKGKMFKRLGATTLVLTLISMSLMGGTLAKYTTTVSGKADATVAKFAFDLSGATQSTDEITINDLFASSYNNNTVSASEKVVAPGTSGKQEFKLENKGDVNIIVKELTITPTNANNIPLQYAITGGDTDPTEADWKSDTNTLTSPGFTNLANGASQTFYLHWRWNPASNDTTDTALGVAATATVSIKVDCKVEQVVS